MSKFEISKDLTTIKKDGKPFFMLSDTVWMAFQKLSIKEWKEYIRFRKEQGFNVVQISVLPISHDNGVGHDDIEPFMLKEGKYDFESFNEAYFDKAKEMLQIVKDFGMTPFLHLYWVNYIPDTWAASISPDTVIPFEKLRTFTNYFIDRFDKYDPIYSGSGDTNFDTDLIIKYYIEILDVLNERVPDRLTTLHIGCSVNPPEVLCEHPQYHFYSYQSGHTIGVAPWMKEDNIIDQNSTIKFARDFLHRKVKKPVINTEPCYEGHGHAYIYGRFNSKDIRKASWRSILSGAKSGISYGAHGLWQMYESDTQFNNTEFSKTPYEWMTALRLPGAYDVAFIKWIYEKYSMFELNEFFDLEGYKDRYANQVQVGKNSYMVVMYLPYNDDIIYPEILKDYKIEAISLETRQFVNPRVIFDKNRTIINKTYLNEDILLIATKK